MLFNHHSNPAVWTKLVKAHLSHRTCPEHREDCRLLISTPEVVDCLEAAVLQEDTLQEEDGSIGGGGGSIGGGGGNTVAVRV